MFSSITWCIFSRNCTSFFTRYCSVAVFFRCRLVLHLLADTFAEQFPFAEQLIDPCQQILFAEWLGYICVRTQSDRFGLGTFIVLGCQNNDRDMADLKILPDRLQLPVRPFPASSVRSLRCPVIQMHFLQSFYAVIGYMDIEFIFQLQFYQLAQVFIILYQQKSR